MSSYAISVVIPTHKRPKLLQRAIKSVLAQTLLPFEIIIVDDAGSPESEEVLKGFNSKLLRYVHNADGQGASSSRNLGAKLSRGDFVAFLDDDDEWVSVKLEKQRDLIKKSSLDACFSQIQIIYEDTDLSYPTASCMPADPLTLILRKNFIGGTISAVIKREVFENLQGFDLEYKAREEYDLWIKIVLNGFKIGIVEEPLAVAYRSLNRRQRISANINNYVLAVDRLNEKYKNEVNSHFSKKEKNSRTKMQYEFLAAQAVSIGLRQEAVIYYAKSLGVKPSVKACIGLLISAISPKLLIKIRSKV